MFYMHIARALLLRKIKTVQIGNSAKQHKELKIKNSRKQYDKYDDVDQQQSYL